MRAIQSLRDRRNRLTRWAAWWSIAAAFCFALPPSLHAPAIASTAADAPPGFLIVCTAEGAAFVPADPAQPPPDSAPDHDFACKDCCAPQTASASALIEILTQSRLARPVDATANSAPRSAEPTRRPFSRGPPAV